jgi:hypothetical protein
MIYWFYDIVKDAINHDNKEEMRSMYALKLSDMRHWVEEQLDFADIPKGSFRDSFLYEMFRGSSEEPYELWSFIQKYCEPDPDTEDEDEEDS